MLCVDDIMQYHYFTLVDSKSLRRVVFVWTWKHPKYRRPYHEFFVLADGRLWLALTAYDLLDGYMACKRACAVGLSLDEPVCSERHDEYVSWEHRILGKF